MIKDKIYICSRFRSLKKDPSEKAKEQEGNERRAIAACRVAADLGFEPRAPHIYLPRFLDDDIAWQRELGMVIGLDWLAECEEVWVFQGMDGVISEGMARELEFARSKGKMIRYFTEPEELAADIAEAMEVATSDKVAEAIKQVLDGGEARPFEIKN